MMIQHLKSPLAIQMGDENVKLSFQKPHLFDSNQTEATYAMSTYSSSSSLAESNESSSNEHMLLDNESKSTSNIQSSSLWDFWLEPRISQGNLSLPFQSESRPFLKYLILIPISTLVTMTFACYFWLPILQQHGWFSFVETFALDILIPNRLAMMILVVIPLIFAIFVDIITDAWTFCMLIRGRRRRHLPAHIPRLVHAVIVCNYKEPLDVLRATINSIAHNTLASNTVVVLACEDRDEKAGEVFDTLSGEFQGSFRNFIKTTHQLQPGEIAGKSSNENYACRQLYQMLVEDEGLDPFQVMVTTCDADSLFDGVFLEQVEAEYCRMPNGSRFIYNSPINTYRNVPECHWLVKSFEIRRCQYDLFSGLSFRPAQSNYSLTLGFAHELNFWDPSNTSEDFHSTLKAMAMTGTGSEVVVRVWSLIINDSVTSFHDRWVQAKRHMWGIEEVAFCLSLFPVIRMTTWLGMFSRVGFQMFGVCIPTFLWLAFRPVRDMLFSLRQETQYALVVCYLSIIAYDWIKTLGREILLYRFVIGNRKLMSKRSLGEWVQLFLVWPLISEISCLIFATMATWRMLLHAVQHETLAYVTAPKALYVKNTNDKNDDDVPLYIETNTIKPKKSV